MLLFCKYDDHHLMKQINLPVLTNLNVTLFWVLSASLRLGCTKSFSTPPLDEAILLI